MSVAGIGRRNVVLVLLVALALIVSACGTPASGSSQAAATDGPDDADPTAPPAAEITVINVGAIAPRLASLPQLVAADYLLEEGIVLNFVYFQSDGATIQALASGAIDMATVTPIRPVQINDAGGDVKMFASAWGALDWVLVANDSVQSLDDLPGHTIGISSPGSGTDVLTRELLATRDLTPEDDNITLIAVGATGARASALAAGSIDVAWVGYDAAYPLLEENEGFQILEDVSVAQAFPNYFSSTWTATSEYIAENPDLVMAVTRAQVNANRWAQDQDAFVERTQGSIITALEEQSEEQIRWAHEFYIADGMFQTGKALTPERIAGHMDISLKSGEIEALPEFESVVDDSFEDAVLEELGPYEGS